MKIVVQSMGLTPHAPLEEHMEKKLNKLENYYDKIVECQVHLKVENKSDKENKTVEILLAVPGDDIMVKKEAKTFEEAIDENVKTLERQLKKKKQKQKVHL